MIGSTCESRMNHAKLLDVYGCNLRECRKTFENSLGLGKLCEP